MGKPQEQLIVADIDLVRPQVGDEEIEAVRRVLRSGQLTQGSEVDGFEREFSALVGGRQCVAVSSGTSALHLLMLALGIGPGAEVIVPSFTFAATANVVRLCGATVRFADIEPDTYCLDPDSVAAAITPRTAAIVAVHLFGQPAAMDRLAGLADRHGLPLLEDAAQAHGAALAGRPVGTFGTAAAFSFHATKNMHTVEGGMIVTADPHIAETARLLRNQGMRDRFLMLAGLNARMNDLCAAIGRVQLRALPAYNAARQANAARLDALLPGEITPRVRPGAEHVYHQYTVRLPGRRQSIQDGLARAGIPTAIHYAVPVHQTPPYDLDHDLDLPESTRAAGEVLSLPIHPALREAQLDHIAITLHGLWS